MSHTSTSQTILETRGAEIESIFTMSRILQTGLDRRTIAVLLELIEAGVHPEALADVVNELKASSATSAPSSK